jgi:hypothetical protein
MAFLTAFEAWHLSQRRLPNRSLPLRIAWAFQASRMRRRRFNSQKLYQLFLTLSKNNNLLPATSSPAYAAKRTVVQSRHSTTILFSISGRFSDFSVNRIVRFRGMARNAQALRTKNLRRSKKDENSVGRNLYAYLRCFGGRARNNC